MHWNTVTSANVWTASIVGDDYRPIGWAGLRASKFVKWLKRATVSTRTSHFNRRFWPLENSNKISINMQSDADCHWWVWCDGFASASGQQFVESQNVGVCVSELQSMEYGEVRAQCRLRVAQSLVVAVDNASDAIEITDENHHTQVRSRPGWRGSQNCRLYRAVIISCIKSLTMLLVTWISHWSASVFWTLDCFKKPSFFKV